MTLAQSPVPQTPVSEATLREMTWRDIPSLAALEPELFADDAWSEQTWWAELAGRPRRAYVVAERLGTVVGYAGVHRGGEVADVMTVAVAPTAQGQGLGKTLLDWLVAQARRGGAEHLMLEVRADNPAAQRLYARAGFVMLTVRRRYYQPGNVDALIMRLCLEESTKESTKEASKDATEDAIVDPAADMTQDVT
jgi:ribosomal-protein-alanine N-acetyltransferase